MTDYYLLYTAYNCYYYKHNKNHISMTLSMYRDGGWGGGIGGGGGGGG